MSITILSKYRETRAYTEFLVKHLSDADMTVQSMSDTSPAKWHLAHTTWFFEMFILNEFVHDYELFDEQFPFLFNSYYETAGPRHQRSQRGLITRPSKDEVLAYRSYVDEAMLILVDTHYGSNDELSYLLELGINHEQQHQELLQTDILHLFAQSPLKPVFDEEFKFINENSINREQWIKFNESEYFLGHQGSHFAYDNESPKHKVFVPSFEISSNLITNRQWLTFIEDDGYKQALLWLSDGWTVVKNNAWNSPLYWEQHDNQWYEMSLHGMKKLDLDAPVKHISYFEADAYAAWAKCRLPTEYEWEIAASSKSQLTNMFGLVWQWTRSPYIAYPGFRIAQGAIGEYNGKFMCNQFVLRGSSTVTSKEHSRISYRNFFYPHQRWQFTGLRLARDIE